MRNLFNLSLGIGLSLLISFSLNAQVRRTTENNGTTVRRTTRKKDNGSQVRRTSRKEDNGSKVRRTTRTEDNGSQVRRTTRTEDNGSQVNNSNYGGISTVYNGGVRRRVNTEYIYSNGKIRRVNSSDMPKSQSQPPITTNTLRYNSNVTNRGLGTYQRGNNNVTGYYDGQSYYLRDNRYGDEDCFGYKIYNNNVYRIPPSYRNYISYNKIAVFYSPNYRYFGWKVQNIPPTCEMLRDYDTDYYVYNNVYYRRADNCYIVSRPPVGVVLDNLQFSPQFRQVGFAYYPSIYRSYRGYEFYNRNIDRWNRIVASYNSSIANGNSMFALNRNAAKSSYKIAYKLGLVQSYPYANQRYFYQDGVFYIINNQGYYEVVTPPAGALINSLPEDYRTIKYNNAEYYQVDNTVYRTILISGIPYLEVLGQAYGDMYGNYEDGYMDY